MSYFLHETACRPKTYWLGVTLLKYTPRSPFCSRSDPMNKLRNPSWSGQASHLFRQLTKHPGMLAEHQDPDCTQTGPVSCRCADSEADPRVPKTKADHPRIIPELKRIPTSFLVSLEHPHRIPIAWICHGSKKYAPVSIKVSITLLASFIKASSWRRKAEKTKGGENTSTKRRISRIVNIRFRAPTKGYATMVFGLGPE